MTALEAREAVVAALREEGAIARTEPYTHNVPFSHRSGERIEPLISLQWFMRMDELVKPAIEVVTSGRIKIHPENWTRVYLNWMENIRPWCISRQLWWGHQIPVWYRGEEETYCGMEPPEGEGWARDPDVLDTWFSSGLWPFATLGWPEDTRAAARLLPDRRALDGPRDPLPVGRPDDHVRDRVRGRHPVHRRLPALDHPGPRRPPDVEVARDRDRPAGADRGRPAPARVRAGRRLPRLRRRRGPLRPARDVLLAGRPLQRGQGRPGPPARQQALERVAARAAARPRRAARAARRRPSRTRGSCRACSAPRPPPSGRSRPSSSTAPCSASTTSSTATSATGTSS